MKKTAWYPIEISPMRTGWYEIQDKSLRCGCCCMDAFWNGAEFVRFGRFADVMDVYEVFRNVTKWRGLTEKANVR